MTTVVIYYTEQDGIKIYADEEIPGVHFIRSGMVASQTFSVSPKIDKEYVNYAIRDEREVRRKATAHTERNASKLYGFLHALIETTPGNGTSIEDTMLDLAGKLGYEAPYTLGEYLWLVTEAKYNLGETQKALLPLLTFYNIRPTPLEKYERGD